MTTLQAFLCGLCFGEAIGLAFVIAVMTAKRAEAVGERLRP